MYTLFPYAEVLYSPDARRIKFTVRLLEETQTQEIAFTVEVPDEFYNLLDKGTK
jgi:hypothetical protein